MMLDLRNECLKRHVESFSYCAIRILTNPAWPQVAAACSGVHSSLSCALTLAPRSNKSFTISSKLSIQHWGGEKRNRNSFLTHILLWKLKEAERENDSESRKDWATLLCIYVCGFGVTTEHNMKWGAERSYRHSPVEQT